MADNPYRLPNGVLKIADKYPILHPKCRLIYDGMNGDYDCGYQSILTCEDCKYGLGRKDPAAECNQP